MRLTRLLQAQLQANVDCRAVQFPSLGGSLRAFKVLHKQYQSLHFRRC